MRGAFCLDSLSGLGFQQRLDAARIAHLEVYVCVVLTVSEAWKVYLKQFSK